MNHPIDEQFEKPRFPVSIAALPNADWEVQAMRAVLEGMGCAVAVHWVGTPSDFLKVLSLGASAPRYLLISGHGDEERGICFGDYGPGIDTSMLREGYMPADVIAPIVNLPGCTVVASACAGGARAMERAFIGRSGVHAYIACRDYPDGSVMLVWLVNFFFGVVSKHLSDRDAFHRAIAATDHPDMEQMRFFQQSETEAEDGQEPHASL